MGVQGTEIRLDQPKDPAHGDLATNVALTLAGPLGLPPRTIAEDIASRLQGRDAGIEAVEIAGPGFLNFRLSTAQVASILVDIIEADELCGRGDEGGGEPIMVEFVSANPTGPLHLGHGRQGSIGDAIAGLLEWTGWSVSREYYYNDAGAQIDRLAESVWARYQQSFGGDAPIPDGGYQGAYVSEIAADLADVYGERFVGVAGNALVCPFDDDSHILVNLFDVRLASDAFFANICKPPLRLLQRPSQRGKLCLLLGQRVSRPVAGLLCGVDLFEQGVALDGDFGRPHRQPFERLFGSLSAFKQRAGLPLSSCRAPSPGFQLTFNVGQTLSPECHLADQAVMDGLTVGGKYPCFGKFGTQRRGLVPFGADIIQAGELFFRRPHDDAGLRIVRAQGFRRILQRLNARTGVS